jgi:hypothetical protein
MADAAAARQLAAAAAAADGGEPLPPPPARNGVTAPVGPDALGDGEFLLAVKQPRRVVPRARLVRSRIPGPRARGGF